MAEEELWADARETAEDLATRCRICLGDEESAEDPLVSPCACRGSQALIHWRCLEKCQQSALRSGVASHKCTVCLETFSVTLAMTEIPPLHSGKLLVANESLEGTFSRSVILLCHADAIRARGLVLTRPLRQPPGEMQGMLPRTVFLRGGPVCGGRFGLVRYVIGRVGRVPHASFPHAVALADDDGSSRKVWLPDTWSPLGFREMLALVTRLLDEDEDCEVLIFAGYCAWGPQQLDGELRQGVWGLVDGTLSDVDACRRVARAGLLDGDHAEQDGGSEAGSGGLWEEMDIQRVTWVNPASLPPPHPLPPALPHAASGSEGVAASLKPPGPEPGAGTGAGPADDDVGSE